MDQPPSDNREEYIKQLLPQISKLTDELARIDETGTGPYADTYKRLHDLKERYRQLTGIYPRLSPSKH